MAAVAQVLADLTEAVDALAGVDPVALRDNETVLELWREAERLSALATRATAALDAVAGYADDGARSAAAWLAGKTNVPAAVAKRRVKLGVALRAMPEVEAAWVAGEVTDCAVDLLGRAQRLNPECFARDESMLVGQAKDLQFRHLRRTIEYWCQLADPDKSEDEAESKRERRGVHLSETFGGTWVLDGTFDPISGTILDNELRRLEQQLFEQDWKEARARLGDAATLLDLARTPAQRRADAMVEMAERSRAMPKGSRMPQPLFTVLVGYERFAGPICELSNGTVVTPGSLVPYLDEAMIERVVFDSPSRVIDVGVRQRLFTGATRRAIEVRDRECFHPLCDMVADDCEGDHVEPYALGGLTVQENGRMACAHHNRNGHNQQRNPGRNRSP